ncbi:HAD family hydrolase [Aegicerativicinus sediminis]|uniref:HAD family hydrolase n=1 Tax=Aegicerativicinus sediminis TaxID=2893202 RepID=UPI001E4E0A24|nr:HAD family hydrolase [Aegicerativicinus sediminis]
MPNFECVIFDCDGVLVDSEPLSNGMLVTMANELGASIDLDFAYRNFKGHSLQHCLKVISTLIQDSLPRTFENEYRERSYEIFKTEMTPIEGIEEVLQSLDKPFCVASSGPREKIRLNLKKTGLLPYFQNAIYSCYDIQKWKPDPGIFLHAAASMGFKVEDCLVIEDSVAGVTAAKNGGFEVLAFTENDVLDELTTISNGTFGSMKELRSLLSV